MRMEQNPLLKFFSIIESKSMDELPEIGDLIFQDRLQTKYTGKLEMKADI